MENHKNENPTEEAALVVVDVLVVVGVAAALVELSWVVLGTAAVDEAGAVLLPPAATEVVDSGP